MNSIKFDCTFFLILATGIKAAFSQLKGLVMFKESLLVCHYFDRAFK